MVRCLKAIVELSSLLETSIKKGVNLKFSSRLIPITKIVRKLFSLLVSVISVVPIETSILKALLVSNEFYLHMLLLRTTVVHMITLISLSSSIVLTVAT